VIVFVCVLTISSIENRDSNVFVRRYNERSVPEARPAGPEAC
jgi:hypothetical protein